MLAKTLKISCQTATPFNTSINNTIPSQQHNKQQIKSIITAQANN